MKPNHVQSIRHTPTPRPASMERFHVSMTRVSRRRSDLPEDMRVLVFGPVRWQGPQALQGALDASRGTSLANVSPHAIEAWLDGLCSEIVEQVLRAGETSSSRTGPTRLELHFDSGRLAGLQCAISLRGKRIGCSFRTRSAVLRHQLGLAGRRLADRLEGVGFVLRKFEVGP